METNPQARDGKPASGVPNAASKIFQCNPRVVGKKHFNLFDQNGPVFFIENQGMIIKSLAHQKKYL